MARERFKRNVSPGQEIEALTAQGNHLSVPNDLFQQSGVEIVEWYKQSLWFQRKIDYVLQQDWPRLSNSVKGFQRVARGIMFEEIAYAFISSELKQEEVLLTPHQTFQFYRSVYRGDTDYFPMGQRTIKGVSVPDGLIVDTSGLYPKVTHICEYTSSNSYKYLDKSEQKKAVGRDRARQNMGLLMGESEALYVVPQDSKLLPTFSARHQTIPVPITTKQLDDLVLSCHIIAGADMALPRILGSSF